MYTQQQHTHTAGAFCGRLLPGHAGHAGHATRAAVRGPRTPPGHCLHRRRDRLTPPARAKKKSAAKRGRLAAIVLGGPAAENNARMPDSGRTMRGPRKPRTMPRIVSCTQWIFGGCYIIAPWHRCILAMLHDRTVALLQSCTIARITIIKCAFACSLEPNRTVCLCQRCIFYICKFY